MTETLQHIEDAELITLFSAPTEVDRAMRILIKQYGEMLYRKIRSIVKSHQDTDDVMQKTLMKVLKHIDQFKGESKLSTWMYQIATREALNHIRSSGRKRTIELPEELVHVGSQASHFEVEDAEQWVIEACEMLPPVQRSVFEYRYYENLSFKEISLRMGSSQGGLKASYHHAAKKVENYLKSKLIH